MLFCGWEHLWHLSKPSVKEGIWIYSQMKPSLSLSPVSLRTRWVTMDQSFKASLYPHLSSILASPISLLSFSFSLLLACPKAARSRAVTEPSTSYRQLSGHLCQVLFLKAEGDLAKRKPDFKVLLLSLSEARKQSCKPLPRTQPWSLILMMQIAENRNPAMEGGAPPLGTCLHGGWGKASSKGQPLGAWNFGGHACLMLPLPGAWDLEAERSSCISPPSARGCPF